MITKAVIPAAGLGSRMRPFTRVVPKELAPLGSQPAIDWVIDEAVAAGLEQLAVVVSPAKTALVEYLENWLAPRHAGVRLELITQAQPSGLADAIHVCRDFTGVADPFVLLLPDNILPSRDDSLSSLIELARSSRLDVVGAIELDASWNGLYGDVGRFESDADLKISRLYDKGRGMLELAPGQRQLRTCGRYVCQPHVHDVIEALRAESARLPTEARVELSEVPVYQRLLSQGADLLAGRLPGPLFDVGHARGYLAACAWLNDHVELLGLDG